MVLCDPTGGSNVAEPLILANQTYGTAVTRHWGSIGAKGIIWYAPSAGAGAA